MSISKKLDDKKFTSSLIKAVDNKQVKNGNLHPSSETYHLEKNLALDPEKYTSS